MIHEDEQLVLSEVVLDLKNAVVIELKTLLEEENEEYDICTKVDVENIDDILELYFSLPIPGDIAPDR